jgi:hypothetical protein
MKSGGQERKYSQGESSMKMNTVLRNALFSLAGMGLLLMPVAAQVLKGVPQYV